METTKKIERVRENIKNYVGKNGQIYVHGVTVEGDPQEWEYDSQQDKCTKFTPGIEATFTTEVKVNGNYTNYKIKPVFTNKPAFGGAVGGGGFKGGGFKAEPKDQKQITWLSCFSSVCNLYTGSSLITNFDEILAKANKAYEEALSHTSK